MVGDRGEAGVFLFRKCTQVNLLLGFTAQKSNTNGRLRGPSYGSQPTPMWVVQIKAARARSLREHR